MSVFLEKIAKSLLRNSEAVDLVKKMSPLDVVSVFAKDYGLSPKDASRLALDLIKQSEGLSPPAIERGQYPVPPLIRRDNEKEEHIARGNKIDITPKFVVKRFQFPQDPEAQPEEWPFDDHTVAGMKGKNKQHKRGLTASKDNSDTRRAKYIKKNPFDADMRIAAPGGDGGGGGGIYSKSFHGKSGDMPGAGNSSWVARGTKGWNSPPGQTFDKPPGPKKKPRPVGENERVPNAGDDDPDEPQFLKNPNTGASASVGYLGYGGRTPPRTSKAGYRGYGKK